MVPESLGIQHFAAFPPGLVRPIVLGWSPPGVCVACGQGRRPVVDRELIINHIQRRSHGRGEPAGRGLQGNHGAGEGKVNGSYSATITGYACACPQPTAPTRPALVLDPFAGTGTTMLVASVLGRTGIGVDLSMDYCRLAQWRTSDPGERARAMQVPKPPPVPDGQQSLFGGDAA